MSRTYPRVDARLNQRWKVLANCGKSGPKCDAIDCKAPAHYRADIEVNWFRGDDEVARACEAHKDDAHALLEGLAQKGGAA